MNATKLELAGIPEIVLKIAGYLERPELIECVRVCKAWNKLLSFTIWNDVDIARGGPRGGSTGPSAENLKEHRELVCKLRVFDYSINYYSAVYPKLHSLSLEPGLETGDCEPNSLSEFVELNPTLTQLRIRKHRGCLDENFWKTVSKLSKLSELELFQTQFESNDSFWITCGNLELLYLYHADITVNKCLNSDILFNKIRILIFYSSNPVPANLEIIRRSPNLEKLVWHLPDDPQYMETLSEIIQKGCCPKLEILELGYCLEDVPLSHVIEGVQRITKLSLADNRFGLQSFRSLERHFSTLVELDLCGCENASSPMLNIILCSATNLKKFSGDYILAEDIVRGKPWVCLSLTYFRACFFLRFSEPQHPVFKQLSALTKLNTLILKPPVTSPFTPFAYLNFRLSDGLGELETLKNLSHISVDKTAQSILVEDVQWMLDNWKHLKLLMGELCHDSKTNSLILSLLHRRGVDTNWQML
ncbi:hypothetical protein BGZ76_007208 [Entomortierella beljakovae]|nr:hypothetical protein BGZ76_007208 [Entomortierella beljakovae]